ncbi:LysR family transcriptional regulator [Paratractidigestivibacter sp.]|uniref:LysR family transcriptional regulator n=1 Tax=Paratractidigestivibacter sp. TaxID=2847316 RepID=UPI002ABE6618|nr:LysR family transcriptional regulator [Paratractidigestivibacter sp.]
MTLTQLRYVVAVAEAGSISAAAARLFIAQPSLSKAVGELEAEMGVRIFERSSRGVRETEEGTRFLSYARQVVEQADLLENQYLHGTPPRRVFAVSSQHYAFVVNAFVELVHELGREKYEFSLREGTTAGIIDDVRTQRSELGVIYRSHFNREVIAGAVVRAELRFEPLFTARPHVFVSRTSPLADRASVTLGDLAPFPRLTYDQGAQNSFFFSEEPHPTEAVDKQIVVTDRATLFNLLIGLNGYTISSGILSTDLNGDDIVAVPLESDEEMEVGYLKLAGRPLSDIGERYIERLRGYVKPYLAAE